MLGSNQDTNSTPTVDAFDDQHSVSPPSIGDVNVESIEQSNDVELDSDDITDYDNKHQDEKNYIIIGIAFSVGRGALIYDLIFR